MHVSQTPSEPKAQRYRPSTVSVFAAAFVAGAVVAFGLNRVLDAHLAQSRPQVESVPIFVALRSLPQGSPVTVWDVALRDWPKAMLPTTALEAKDSFEGMILRHPLREGQPLLSVHLVRPQPEGSSLPIQDEVFAAPTPAIPQVRQVEADLWTPAVATPAESATPLPTGGEPTLAGQPTPPGVPSAGPPTAQLPTVAISSSPVEEVADVAPAEVIQAEVRDPNPPVSTETPEEPEPTAVVSDAVVNDALVSDALVSDEVSEAVIQDTPAEPTLAETLPPVPASPPTDIERPLKAVSKQRFASQGPAFNDTPYAGPAVAESVLTDLPAAAAAPTTTSSTQQPMRYLVVPERIALEADVSFVTPRPVAEPSQAPQTPPSGRPHPGTAGTPRTSPPQKQAAAPPAQSQRPIGGLFPNVAAGLDALGTFRGSQAPPSTRSR